MKIKKEKQKLKNNTINEQSFSAKLADVDDGSSRQQKLYHSIVEDIKKKYNYKLTEAEAHEAARNMIDFYRELMK